MTKNDIIKAITKYVEGQGNQVGLGGLSDILKAIVGTTESVVMEEMPYTTTLNVFESTDLTAEEAVEAGFTMDVIEDLKRMAHPTIKFVDMNVTYNAYEVISDELSIWTTVVYDAPDDKVYHLALYVYSDGRILHNVGEMQH